MITGPDQDVRIGVFPPPVNQNPMTARFGPDSSPIFRGVGIPHGTARRNPAHPAHRRGGVPPSPSAGRTSSPGRSSASTSRRCFADDFGPSPVLLGDTTRARPKSGGKSSFRSTRLRSLPNIDEREFLGCFSLSGPGPFLEGLAGDVAQERCVLRSRPPAAAAGGRRGARRTLRTSAPDPWHRTGPSGASTAPRQNVNLSPTNNTCVGFDAAGSDAVFGAESPALAQPIKSRGRSKSRFFIVVSMHPSPSPAVPPGFRGPNRSQGIPQQDPSTLGVLDRVRC